jgi:hypothetical protein
MFLDITDRFIALNAPYSININHTIRRDLRLTRQDVQRRLELASTSVDAGSRSESVCLLAWSLWLFYIEKCPSAPPGVLSAQMLAVPPRGPYCFAIALTLSEQHVR